jgi:hypothetical protein
MRVITKRSLIRQVAAHWKAQYSHGEPKAFVGVGERLAALDPETATVGDVSAIIGHDGWTRNRCDECKFDSMLVVELGEEPDYESSTARICWSCIQKAVAMSLEAGAKQIEEGA